MNVRYHIPTERLKEEPYASLLCYPKASEKELDKRLVELKKHGVTALEFRGRTEAFNLPILGKGYVGIVVKAQTSERTIALKIRRSDADRPSLQHEARMLARANEIKVGPKLMGASKNFLLMHLVDGPFLPEWIRKHREKQLVQFVLNDLLEQCWRLDNIGLDHGELSKAPKHIIIHKQQKPFIVDFETASIKRRPANVTSICNFLFISGNSVSSITSEVMEKRNYRELLSALKLYKKYGTRENFTRILKICLS